MLRIEHLNPQSITIPLRLLPKVGPVTQANPAFHLLIIDIEEKGCKNPIFIRKNATDVELVEGYYRLEASIAAKLKNIPVVYVCTLGECQLAEVERASR